MNFTTKLVLGTALVFGAGVTIILLSRNPEAARVEEILRAAVHDAREGKATRVIGLLSPSFSQEGEDFEAVAARIRQHVKPGNFRLLESRSIDVIVDGDEARVVVFLRVDAASSPYPGGLDLRLELTMRRHGAQWLVTGYRVPREVGDFLK